MKTRTAYYIAANSETELGGIYGFGIDSDQICFEPQKGSSYLAFSPNRDLLYSVSKADVNYASVYRIRKNESLEFLDRRPTHALASCHLTTDPAGDFLYCANYTSGSFTEFRLKDGLFHGADPARCIELQGQLGPNPDRQEHAHAHCTVFSPDKKYLCVVDLGLDEVQIFPFVAGKGVTEKPIFRYRSVNPGAGPRHLLFSPDGKTAWLANEVDNTVSVLSYRDGALMHRQTLSTLPENFSGPSSAAAVRLSPDEKYLCVSNRGHNSFACYRVAENGNLALHGITPSEGRSPRDVNFLPGSGEFVCCNETSNDVSFFHYCNGDFKLKERKIQLPGVRCCLT